MNTKWLMIASSISLGIIGLILSFLPKEFLHVIELESENRLIIIFVQILGGLYFAFAFMNWMAKYFVMGGIYSRPIVLANMTHFIIGALTLVKSYFVDSNLLVLALGIFYSIFAILFIIVFYTHPKPIVLNN
jgi:hypothetical protein